MNEKIKNHDAKLKLANDVKANSEEITCVGNGTTKPTSAKENANDKLESAKAMEDEKELSATALLKKSVSETLNQWNKQHVCMALFANISDEKEETFSRVTDSFSKYPVKNYTGEETVISTEIIDGKDFSFIAFPETLTASNVVTIYNAVCAYDKAQKDSVKNAAENAAKAKAAKARALKLLLDAGVLSQDEYDVKLANI